MIDYLLIAYLLWRERKNLTEFNIDKTTLIIFLLFGSVLRITRPDPHVAFHISVGVNFIVGICLMLSIHAELKDLPLTTGKPFQGLLIGLVAGVVLYVSLNVKEMNAIAQFLSQDKFDGLAAKHIGDFFLRLNYQLSVAAIPEEIIYRGFIWGYFKKIRMKEIWILLVQAGLSWLSHITYFNLNPYAFWVVVPVAGLTMGILVWRYKTVNVSILTHALYNSLNQFFFLLLR